MINSVCGIRSTGRICTDIAQALEAKGHDVKIAYGRESVPTEYQKYAVRIGTNRDVMTHGVQARVLDRSGFGSKRATKDFIKWVKAYDPDVIHLHNLHGYYLNLEVLFDYLKKSGKRVIWTLHDCWPFTGHCVYCRMGQCKKWKTGCHKCIASREYPTAFYDNSKRNWLRKRALFTGVNHLTLITPSNWLANQVKESFLCEYEVCVINNGIDTGVFRHIKSDIKNKYGIADKKVLLGVAAVWDARKGLEDFIKLSNVICSDYVIVLIGLTEEQISGLPHNILGIRRTDNTAELAEWYSAAEVFINPTYEDNYPTTNLEAIACGTPVITYDTGGSPESALLYGKVVENIKNIQLDTVRAECMCNADVEAFSRQHMAENYVNLYS